MNNLSKLGTGIAAMLAATTAQAQVAAEKPTNTQIVVPQALNRSACLEMEVKQDKIVCLMELKKQREANTAALERQNTEIDRTIERQEAALEADKAALSGLAKVAQMQDGPERE